ncbi:MAG: integrin, partial [Myxococcota bacterium]
YVFRRSEGVWRQEAYIKASNTGEGDRFGAAVAFDGATLAIGATDEASGSMGVNSEERRDDVPGSGAVYLFRRASGMWAQTDYIKASNTGPRDFFGFSVAVSGSDLAVGPMAKTAPPLA